MRRHLLPDRLDGFNPPPAVRPGETRGTSLEIIAAPVFQSAPGGEAGGNLPPRRERWTVKLFQSAPGGEAGGNATHRHP